MTGTLLRMKTPATTLIAAAALAVTIGGVAAGSTSTKFHHPDPPGVGRLKQCPPPWVFLDPRVEGCVWDGKHHHENGLPKRSFMVTPAGKVIFLPHYAAHVLLYGEPAVEPTPTETVEPTPTEPTELESTGTVAP